MSSGSTSTAIIPYTPSIPGAVVFIVANLLIAFGSFYHIQKRRSWFILCLPIGAFFIAVGWVMKLIYRSNLDSVPLYAIQSLLIVCMPACFFATNYIFAGRYIAAQRASMAQPAPKLALISEKKLAKVFIFSDVATFLIQMAGGGLQAAPNVNTANLGSRIFLVGVVIQGAFYNFFTVMCAVAHYRLVKITHDSKAGLPFFGLMYLSSLPLFVRTGFRIVEGIHGREGPTFEYESYLFLLDALPLFLSMVVWLACWPVKWFPVKDEHKFEMTSSVDSHSQQLKPTDSA